jgi:sialate O-acetylesterase
MLMRVCPYTLRGFLFYQGESDDHRPESYEKLLEGLIGCWRRDWQDPELPFLNVQLPMFRYEDAPDTQSWCLIREAQMHVYRKLRNTGLAVLTDQGALDNIHPTDKAPVGHRHALQALCEVYRMLSPEKACAPAYRSSFVHGDTVCVETAHAQAGFRLTGTPVQFEIAGTDGTFYPAKAVFAQNRILLTRSASFLRATFRALSIRRPAASSAPAAIWPRTSAAVSLLPWWRLHRITSVPAIIRNGKLMKTRISSLMSKRPKRRAEYAPI